MSVVPMEWTPSISARITGISKITEANPGISVQEAIRRYDRELGEKQQIIKRVAEARIKAAERVRRVVSQAVVKPPTEEAIAVPSPAIPVEKPSGVSPLAIGAGILGLFFLLK